MSEDDPVIDLATEELDELENDPEADGLDEEFDATLTADEIMRQEVIPNLSEKARKFFIVTPGTTGAKKRKRQSKKNKTVVENEGLSAEGSGEKGDGSDEEESTKKNKIEVTVYVFVEPPAKLMPTSATTRGNSRGTSLAAPTPIQRGPFFFFLEDDYQTFKILLAQALPCKEKLLPSAQLQWRYEKPANDKKKPMADEAGFSALKKSLAQRKKEFVINIHMPPPKKEEITWDTGDENYIEKPFDYEEHSAPLVPTALSAKEQIAAIGANSANIVKELQEKYPVDNSPLFPGKRVYQNGKRYWELTTLRLQVWATAIIGGKATVTEPPNSNHFSDQQKLKPPQDILSTSTIDNTTSIPTTQAANTTTAMPFGYGPSLPGPPGPIGYPPYSNPYPPGPPSPFYNYMPYPQPYPMMPYQNFPFHAPYTSSMPQPMSTYFTSGQNQGHGASNPASATATGSPHVSPGKALRMNVPLDEFCARYGLTNDDLKKLQILRYRPGMPGVDQLPAHEWGDGAGFSALEWRSFLVYHQQFLKDVCDGRWISPNM